MKLAFDVDVLAKQTDTYEPAVQYPEVHTGRGKDPCVYPGGKTYQWTCLCMPYG